MEIGSMGSMSQGMQMEGMRRRPPGDPAEHAEKMSAKIMEEQDEDSDGLLSVSELGQSSDSDTIAALDEDGDGFVSQDELQSGLQSTMASMKASFESGSKPSTEDHQFMMQMGELAGPPPGQQAKASQAYGMMQESMYGGGSQYSTDQLLLDSLSATV